MSLARFVEATGGEERWKLINSDRDAAWSHVNGHRDELLAKYPRESIAVHRDRVVVHAADADEFSNQLDDYVARTGMDRNALYIAYMDPDRQLWAL
jgi:LPS O-antigen subunit length determinant protein (WzzB/FepE family)